LGFACHVRLLNQFFGKCFLRNKSRDSGASQC
jgi:hypothetical protein